VCVLSTPNAFRAEGRLQPGMSQSDSFRLQLFAGLRSMLLSAQQLDVKLAYKEAAGDRSDARCCAT